MAKICNDATNSINYICLNVLPNLPNLTKILKALIAMSRNSYRIASIDGYRETMTILSKSTDLIFKLN